MVNFFFFADTNRTRLVRKARPTESFFNFFSPPTPPGEDALENGEIEEEELDELEEKLEMDYQIGEDIKEKIIPRAVDYFTGKALEYDMMDEDEDDYEDLDDDEDDFEDDDVRSGFFFSQASAFRSACFCVGSHDADWSVMYRTLKATTTSRQQDVAVPRRAVAVVPPDRRSTPRNVNNSSCSFQCFTVRHGSHRPTVTSKFIEARPVRS